MKYICVVIGFFYLFVSCKSSNKNNGEISYQKPIILTDSLFMQMPGNIYYVDDNIIIEDAFAKNNFYKLYDSSGCLMKSIASVGNSSIEFITPTLTLLVNNDVVISDMNRGNAIIYNKNTDTISHYENISPELLKKVPLINIDSDVFVTINNFFKGDSEGELFNIYDKNILKKSFGKFPINEKMNNRYDVLQGFVGYNKHHKILVFFSYIIPYYAIYKNVKDNNFELIKEEEYAKFNYSFKNNNLIVNGFQKDLIVSEVALLKDYIVTLGNTEEDLKFISPKNGRDRDFGQLPRSLFVYDYNHNLIKIISLQTPTIRIASNIDSNVLYLINYIEGEFKLSKVSI